MLVLPSTDKRNDMINIQRAHELKEILLTKYTDYLEGQIKFIVENGGAEVVDARELAKLRLDYDLASQKYHDYIIRQVD